MKMQFPESFVRVIHENLGKIKTEKIMFKIMVVTGNPSQITVLQTNTTSASQLIQSGIIAISTLKNNYICVDFVNDPFGVVEHIMQHSIWQ